MNLRVGFLLCGDSAMSGRGGTCPRARPARSLLQLKRHLLLLLLLGDIPKEKSPSKHSFLHLAFIKRCVPAAGCSVSLQPGRRRWILCPLALIAQASLWLHGVGKYTVPSMWEGFEVSGKVLCFWCFSRAISFCLFFLSLSLSWQRRRS